MKRSQKFETRVKKTEHEPNVEIEQKYLLASESDAKKLEEKIKQLFPDFHIVGDYSETSYYYPKITKEKAKYLLGQVVGHGKESVDWQDRLDHIPETTPIIFRLRTRKSDNDEVTGLTFKAGQNPLHDIERIEVELEDINPMFRAIFSSNSGIDPESIWHSDRRIFSIDENTKVDIENVTGYGWQAEIESNDLSRVNEIAGKLSLQPLSREMLDAMYKQYVQNWQKYYTSKGYYPDEGHDGYFSEEDWKEIESTSNEKVIKNQIN